MKKEDRRKVLVLHALTSDNDAVRDALDALLAVTELAHGEDIPHVWSPVMVGLKKGTLNTLFGGGGGKSMLDDDNTLIRFLPDEDASSLFVPNPLIEKTVP